MRAAGSGNLPNAVRQPAWQTAPVPPSPAAVPASPRFWLSCAQSCLHLHLASFPSSSSACPCHRHTATKVWLAGALLLPPGAGGLCCRQPWLNGLLRRRKAARQTIQANVHAPTCLFHAQGNPHRTAKRCRSRMACRRTCRSPWCSGGAHVMMMIIRKRSMPSGPCFLNVYWLYHDWGAPTAQPYMLFCGSSLLLVLRTQCRSRRRTCSS